MSNFEEITDSVIALIKSNQGIELQEILDQLALKVWQFQRVQPQVKKLCYRHVKKWYAKIPDKLPAQVRRNTTATLIYGMLPTSHNGLKEEIGVGKDAITKAVKALHENRLLHITGYVSTPTYLAPTFGKGYGEDVPRPSSIELARQRWKRHNKTPERKVAQQVYFKNNIEKRRQSAKHYYEKNKAEITEKSVIRQRAKRLAVKLEKIEESIKTSWVGSNPFDALRVVHSCSSADVAYLKK